MFVPLNLTDLNLTQVLQINYVPNNDLPIAKQTVKF